MSYYRSWAVIVKSSFLYVKYSEGSWEGGEIYEEIPQASSTMEESQSRPPAYWASPSRGLRHGGLSMGLPPPPQVRPRYTTSYCG